MTSQEFRALAPAKVNLFLHVGPVQANGRHPLDSLVVFSGPRYPTPYQSGYLAD